MKLPQYLSQVTRPFNIAWPLQQYHGMSRYRNEKSIAGLVIHCAATPNGRVTTAADIDRWHGERTPPFNRTDDARVGSGPWIGKNQHAIDLKHIGYHFFIRVNGAVEVGRRLTETGAHVKGYNSKSIAICMAGTDRFTPEQWNSLRQLVQGLSHQWKTGFNRTLEVYGHRQLDPHKTCPGFDVPAWLENKIQPLDEHILKLNDEVPPDEP